MSEVTASFDTLMRQAPSTIALYLRDAVREIDNIFGKGYSAEHPNLVAAFITACASDFNFSAIQKELIPAIEDLASSLSEIADAIRG